MRRTSAFFLTLATFAFLGCANDFASIKAEKMNPQFAGGAGKKTLVIVATNDPAGRENLETQFAIEGVNRGVVIEPSHRVIANFKDITREAVMDLVKANSYDRVIIARGVPGSLKKGQHSYASDYYSVVGSGLAYPSLYDYWGGPTMVTVFSPTDPPPSLTLFADLQIETAMYDASNATLIWSSVTEITTSREKGDAAKSYVRTVVGRMKSASLL